MKKNKKYLVVYKAEMRGSCCGGERIHFPSRARRTFNIKLRHLIEDSYFKGDGSLRIKIDGQRSSLAIQQDLILTDDYRNQFYVLPYPYYYLELPYIFSNHDPRPSYDAVNFFPLRDEDFQY